MKPVFHSAVLHFDQSSLEITPNKLSLCDALYVDFKITEQDQQQDIQLFVHPKQDIILKKLVVRFSFDYASDSRVFCQGLQSASVSGEYGIRENPFTNGWLVPKSQLAAGANTLKIDTNKKAALTSWSFGHIRRGNNYCLIGSLNEQTAFTHIQYAADNNQIIIEKDCAGLALSHSFPLLQLLIAQGLQTDIYKKYRQALNIPDASSPALSGWLANRRAGTNTLAAIKQHLDLLDEWEASMDLVMIGDGYEKAIGDWLYSNDQFPEKLPVLMQNIKARDRLVGIVMAPFICAENSTVFQQHSDWILKNSQGNLVHFTLPKRGKVYVLDIYHPAVVEHLHVTCFTMTEQWNADIIKAELCYAAYLGDRPHKTRAQVMQDALSLLRDGIKKGLLWVSDVPIGATWGMSDITNITSNHYDAWQYGFPRLSQAPEAPVATQQLATALARSFANYPVVSPALATIQLGDTKQWTVAQQYTILVLHHLLGAVNLVSDHLGTFTSEQWGEWRAAAQYRGAVVEGIAQPQTGVYLIEFKNGTDQYLAVSNLNGKSRTMTVKGEVLELEAGETIVFGG